MPTSISSHPSSISLSRSSGGASSASSTASEPKAKQKDAPLAPPASPSKSSSVALSRDSFDRRLPRSLGELQKMTAPELEKLWTDLAKHGLPPDMTDFRGDLKGAALALNVPQEGERARLWNQWRQNPRIFLWGGKFVGQDGVGHNRLFEGMLGDKALRVFPFQASVTETRFHDEASKSEHKDVIWLDYATKGVKNAWQNRIIPFLPVCAVSDELRMIRPGLYLGKAGVAPKDKVRGFFANALMACFGVKDRPAVNGEPKNFVFFALESPKSATNG